MNESKLKVFTRYKTELEEEFKKLSNYMTKSPVLDFLAVQKEFAELLEKHKGKERLTKEFCDKIDALAVREKKARKAIKEDTLENREKIMDRLIEVESELRAVNIEIFFVNRSLND